MRYRNWGCKGETYRCLKVRLSPPSKFCHLAVRRLPLPCAACGSLCLRLCGERLLGRRYPPTAYRWTPRSAYRPAEPSIMVSARRSQHPGHIKTTDGTSEQQFCRKPSLSIAADQIATWTQCLQHIWRQTAPIAQAYSHRVCGFLWPQCRFQRHALHQHATDKLCARAMCLQDAQTLSEANFRAGCARRSLRIATFTLQRP